MGLPPHAMDNRSGHLGDHERLVAAVEGVDRELAGHHERLLLLEHAIHVTARFARWMVAAVVVLGFGIIAALAT